MSAEEPSGSVSEPSVGEQKTGREQSSDNQEVAAGREDGDGAQSIHTEGSEEEKASSYTVQCRDMFGKIAEYLNGELAGTGPAYARVCTCYESCYLQRRQRSTSYCRG